ncbi:MAG: small multi-drug export protein [Pseudomonadota bacterium]
MHPLLEYGLVFILAATPLVELVVVIPLGVAMGMSLLPVTVVAFVGNALPILGIIALHRVWVARHGPVRRRWNRRARRVWHRYGLPGVALLAPLLTGIHLAAIMALALKARQRPTLYWMVASLALWAVATATATALGLHWLGN